LHNDDLKKRKIGPAREKIKRRRKKEKRERKR